MLPGETGACLPRPSRFSFEGMNFHPGQFLARINLEYDLIWKLQTDELVDRELTPQTKASIRIVLGTVSQNFPS